MSARTPRRRRWEQQGNRRPGQRALSATARRERYTENEVDHAARVAMEAGAIMGRRQGEQAVYVDLAELLDEPTELAYEIGRHVIVQEVVDYLDMEMMRRARENDPEKFARLANICRAHDNGDISYEQFRDELEALAREVRPDLWPADDVRPADIIGGQDRADEEAAWWSGPLPVDGADELLDEVERFLACPPWCATDHTAPDGRATVRVHARTVAAIDRGEQIVARVEIVACDSLESGERSEVEILVKALDAYDPNEAERIAAATVEAARIVRDAR
ncbi:DUF6907 domain-containing protein [Micromonospora echinospora]